ncbi:phospholipase A2 inhibitor-like [Stegodyphus dumicola]|uniref:phospholipase A2 inhibitor-like n=1 Tax=Stegodyphus dumicola TaxID=202533 RepID=UPI0015A89417|nr:phospholipase A2 inhibitor-like [Stegodyphus dumicola]
MLRKLPPETEVLVFVGNEIKDLRLNIFGLENVYEKLHTIDLSNNHIQTIKGKTFHNVANVTKLILNDNDLYIISKDHHPRMFSNFVNLKELHLRNVFTEKIKAGDYLSNLLQIFENSYLFNLRVLNMENNEISRIDQEEFCSLAVLEELYLAHNHLNDIPLNFSCLKYLKKLDVRNNLIPYLSDQTLKSLDTNKQLEINLTSNPFKCDCRMIKTFEWMLTTSVTLSNKEQLYCFDGHPPNVGKRIFTLHLSNLQCTDTE